ncbi:MAG TPA: methyltransferase domain-containing protein [Candidatus Cybelea sp.]|nr:methyltransferase domain-containing protein [Candidatus Cybelea sp.]
MWQDVVDLHDFYGTPLGGVTRRVLMARIRALWPDLHSQSLLGLGFATPYLDPFVGEAERVLALMPAGQGVIHWPAAGRGLVAFADETELPFQDFSIDRVLMVHALESSEHPGDMLREAWRVLSGGGRLMVVVPSRRSLWSWTERTPFGFGQAYSAGQLSRLLRSVSFTPLQTARALHFMPWRSRAWLSGAQGWERFAGSWMPGLAGAVIIEAAKQLYGAKPVKAQRRTKPVLVPVPNVATGRVVPLRRQQPREV